MFPCSRDPARQILYSVSTCAKRARHVTVENNGCRPQALHSKSKSTSQTLYSSCARLHAAHLLSEADSLFVRPSPSPSTSFIVLWHLHICSRNLYIPSHFFAQEFANMGMCFRQGARPPAWHQRIVWTLSLTVDSSQKEPEDVPGDFPAG